MAEWLAKLVHALSGGADPHDAVRSALRAALRARAKVSLDTLNPAQQSIVMSASLEQVRDEDFVISQPSIGGLTHPLAFGEELRIGFQNYSKHHSAITRCLGRIRIPSGSGKLTLFAYRLALPD